VKRSSRRTLRCRSARLHQLHTYSTRRSTRRASKVDPFRFEIVRLLHQHPYTAQQILQRLREGGYTGGYSTLKELVSQLRPPATTAYLTLQFLPGQCAQVDWGSAGWLPVGATRRRQELPHEGSDRACYWEIKFTCLTTCVVCSNHYT
jgi:hypothetical protein